MIVGREGQPRSGKSYETVKFDILEALKAGRKVYARLNGLDHERIAAYIERDVSEVRANLLLLNQSEVKSHLTCVTGDDGSVHFPHLEQGALVVVDECHDFWPVGRAALPEAEEAFFAKHGHAALDVVLLTQDFKEVHRSVVRRMQKKNYYTKLDALGQDKKYSCRMYAAPTAGKFELIVAEKREYDETVWPLYHGLQPGLDKNDPYKGNSTTIWKAHRGKVMGMAAVVVLSIVMIGRFFAGGGESIGAEQQPEKGVVAFQPEDDRRVIVQVPTVPAPTAVPSAAVVVKEPEPEREPGIAYILDVKKNARPRYAGAIGGRHLVEFRANGGGQVMERLTSEQLQALGWAIFPTPYGLRAEADGETLIFTAWPTDLPYQQSQQATQRIKDAGTPALSASETQPGPAPGLRAPLGTGSADEPVAAYGGFRNES